MAQNIVDHKMGFQSGSGERKRGDPGGDPVRCDKDCLGRKMLNI